MNDGRRRRKQKWVGKVAIESDVKIAGMCIDNKCVSSVG